jgi:hypothetical protein
MHLPFEAVRVCPDLPMQGPPREESGEAETHGKMTMSANNVLRIWTEGPVRTIRRLLWVRLAGRAHGDVYGKTTSVITT